MSGEPHEIVIIKRVSGGHEDEHHGGVWKIAFADFMTALMAFFLVMWLISANDKTKAVIARYFNPVQLVDSTPQPKGLEDPKAGSPSVMPKSTGASPEAKEKAEKADGKPVPAKAEPAKADTAKTAEATGAAKPPEGAAQTKAEAAASAQAAKEAGLFADPYAVLSEIANKDKAHAEQEKAQVLQDGHKGGAGAVGLKGGAAYRDPFEPIPLPPGTAAANAATDTVSTNTAQTAAAGIDSASAALDAPAIADEPGKASGPADTHPGTLAARIEAAAAKASDAGQTPGPQVDIHHTSEGTVIDLTDAAKFSMFGSASAEPSPRMVRLMETVGRLLKADKGQVTIRGFTDSRSFHSATYDNWRLSAARAHMAHYMLVRGGLDETRIEAIEGYADRRPKNPKDPNAPENRRIEILIRDGGP